MILDDIHSGFLVVIALLEIVIVCMSLLAYCYISNRVINSQKENPYYKKSPTVKWFNSLFILLAVLCFCVAVNFFIRAAWLIGLVLTGLSYVAPMTVWKYYKQLNIFQEKQIPNDVVDELFQEQQQRWIETLENSKLKPDTVKRLITNVKESA